MTNIHDYIRGFLRIHATNLSVCDMKFKFEQSTSVKEQQLYCNIAQW